MIEKAALFDLGGTTVASLNSDAVRSSVFSVTPLVCLKKFDSARPTSRTCNPVFDVHCGLVMDMINCITARQVIFLTVLPTFVK
jgi:hypothetical protein